MEIKYEEWEIEKRFLDEFWKLRKEFYHGEDDPGYWEKLCDSFEKLGKKYNNVYFSQVILNCIDDIERRWKIAKKSRYINPDPLETLYEKLRRKGT